MKKKCLIGLAPLVVVAAFVVIPAASQGFETCTAPNCPHVYKNGVIGGAKVKVRGIAWGTLKLFNEKLGSMECHNVFAGFAENPVGGGAAVGKVQAFYPYECNDPTCKEKLGTIFIESKLPWIAEAVQAKPGEFWGKTGFKGPTPGKPPSTPEFVEVTYDCTSTGAVDFFGENNQLVQNNGASIGSGPGELQLFHESEKPCCAKNLESETGGPVETLGKLKGEGYSSQELLEVKNP